MDVNVLLIGVVVVVAAVLLRRVARREEGEGFLVATLRGWRAPTWPRGVQEEEPVTWHIEPDERVAAPAQAAIAPHGAERQRRSPSAAAAASSDRDRVRVRHSGRSTGTR